jgi:peroxin-1
LSNVVNAKYMVLNGEQVEIGLLHDLGQATSVATEPVSADDWEILELHAGHVESTLLSQVRVAMVGQEINVWVLGRTRVRLQIGRFCRIVGSQLRTKASTVSLDPSTRGNALLLTSGTEVSIAPKLRKDKSRVSASPAAITEKVEGKTQDKETRRRSRVLRVLPSRTLGSLQPSCSALQDESIAAVGFVSRVLLNEVAEKLLYARPQAWRATVKRLPPPADPSQESNASSAPTSTPALPRVLVPQEKTAPKNIPGVVSNDGPPEILLVWSPDVTVPDGHIVFYGSTAGVEEWDHVL